MSDLAAIWPDVSRETSRRLEQFATLLRRWNPAINLVSRATLDELETRHLLDSVQLFDLAPAEAVHWADLGSGGGFPGLVIAIMAVEKAPAMKMTLIESDKRKAAFLTTAIRELDLENAQVHAIRIEDVAPLGADVLSARALAPLPVLLGFAECHLRPGGVALFPKGARHAAELDAALASWRFDVQKIHSKTDPQAVILKLGGIFRV
ncbi:16S rRNA m(7)G-527 methyltransferase [Rhodovulum sp. ES.010]|uniref:16S rRNA (guanine(527)-N(7))-methyltransferase RsmG n=1 Tax=Rhodovulum sp. ES.010 TaxID=1882821 RepID=UPI00092788AD|nr:16S rRNA (guanine(527)-N(7))-methyltransferase RsmG [Rhodovulum sp. ES.010]SIO49416.1 16S rRNA m(7)G-527 methyltransferase [Rhodovulum sp. ES.010]